MFLGVRLSGGAKVLGDHDRNVEIRLPHTVKVQGITLDQYTAELTEDAPTVQLHANILPAEAENHEISWYSQNESIATVTDDGLVTGIERGRTRIYAKSADTGVVRSCMVNVNFTPKAESMTVYNGDVSVSNVTGLNMKEGEVIALRAEILPEEAREHTVVTWHTADPNVAFVDNSGVLTAITAGSTSLVVNADNVEFSCKINVSEDTSVTRVTDVSNLHSEHDYASREEHTWLYTAAEKSLIVLTFDENTYTERNFDFLYICDGQNQQLGVYQGDMLSGATVLIYSTGFRIRLTSDSALNYYGFAVEDMKIFPAEELPATLTLDKTINCDVGDMIQTNELSGKMINLTGISEETHLIEKGPLKDTGSGYLVKGNGTAQTTTNLPDLMEITHLTRVNLKDEGNSNTVVVDGVTRPGLVLDSRKGYVAFIKEGFDKTTKGFYIGNEGLSLGDSFWVDRTGQLSATKGNIANWTIDKNSLYVKTSGTDGSLVKLFDIHPTTSGGYIAYNTTGWNTGRLLNNIEGCFYLGTSGISLGEGPAAPFRVNNKGYLWSTSGVIGGWTISNTSLKGGNVTLNSDGSIRGSGWSFNTAGVLTCNDAVIGGVHFKTGSGEANWSGGQMTSGQIGGWTITTSSIYDTASGGGNIKFDTSGDFNILTDGESGIKGAGGDISMKGTTRVTASSGSNKMEITNTSGSLRVGSFGLSINASETSLSGSSKLRLSGGRELYLSSPKAIFNASGENIMIGSSTTLKDYIENIVDTVLKSKTVDFKTNTFYTGETEGHKHSYTKVVSATIS